MIEGKVGASLFIGKFLLWLYEISSFICCHWKMLNRIIVAICVWMYVGWIGISPNLHVYHFHIIAGNMCWFHRFSAFFVKKSRWSVMEKYIPCLIRRTHSQWVHSCRLVRLRWMYENYSSLLLISLGYQLEKCKNQLILPYLHIFWCSSREKARKY